MKILTYEEELELHLELSQIIGLFKDKYGRKPKNVKEFEVFWNYLIKERYSIN